jgi:flagellar hook-length control protein FliK
MADLSQVENMTANKLLAIVNDESQTKDMRAAAKRELATRSMGQDTTKSLKRSEGGDTPKKRKKKVPAIAISIGMVDAPKNGKGKAAMMRGGMANKKVHMYAGGGDVTDNLKPLPKGPKGKGVRNLPASVQMNMGFDPKS